MLAIIDQSMGELLQLRSKRPGGGLRLESFLEQVNGEFTRSDYMRRYAEISSATASRDLREGVNNKLIKKYGDKKTTRYSVVRKLSR